MSSIPHSRYLGISRMYDCLTCGRLSLQYGCGDGWHCEGGHVIPWDVAATIADRKLTPWYSELTADERHKMFRRMSEGYNRAHRLERYNTRHGHFDQALSDMTCELIDMMGELVK